VTRFLPVIKTQFGFLAGTASLALPFMGDDFRKEIGQALAENKPKLQQLMTQNPYGVPILTGTWGGSFAVTGFGTEMYLLHKAFPESIGPQYTLHALDYVLGRHPASNVSYVSGVGTRSKLIAYGTIARTIPSFLEE